MSLMKRLAEQQAIPKRANRAPLGSKTDKISIQVGKLQVAMQSLYDLGVPLREALRMTNLTPDHYEGAFAHYEGILEEPTIRTALRSGCWRFRLEASTLPGHTKVILPLGPYASEHERNTDRKVAWMMEWLIRPFRFRRIADEVGVGLEGDKYYESYAADWPIPMPVMARVIKLLKVPKAQIDPVREHEAFELLSHYLNQPAE